MAVSVATLASGKGSLLSGPHTPSRKPNVTSSIRRDEKISVGRATRDVLAERAAQDWGLERVPDKRWHVWPHEFRTWNLRTFGWPFLTCLLFWAVTRLAFSVRRRSAVFLAAPIVLILTLLAFLRVESYLFPTLAMIVLGAVSATLTLLNLTAREI